MSSKPETIITIPVLQCKYPDCGNEWVPRTTRMPKVCPKCKRYGWEEGVTQKRKSKGGKKNVSKPVHLGPETQKFLKNHKKEI